MQLGKLYSLCLIWSSVCMGTLVTECSEHRQFSHHKKHDLCLWLLYKMWDPYLMFMTDNDRLVLRSYREESYHHA